ncbi:MAG: hypothetical protein AB7K24_16235 [Gemmataceae bacterium]
MNPHRTASHLPPILILLVMIAPARAADPDPKELLEKALTAVGGQDKLLKLFQMRERLVLGATVPPPPDPKEKGGRVSVLEPPANWWINKRDRGAEPAKFLVHAWTLGILVDPKSKLEALPAANIDGKAVNGLRVSGSVTPPLEMYFDAKEHRLLAIDWRNDRHVFSEWKKTEDGLWYASRAVGFKFTNAKSKTLAKNQWYQTDILELTRLKELPMGLER